MKANRIAGLSRQRSITFALVVAFLELHVLVQACEPVVPAITANVTHGESKPVTDDKLCDFEIELREQFARHNSPDEVFAFATAAPYSLLKPALRHPVALVTLSIYGEKGELRWYAGDSMERYYHRELSSDEIDRVRAFVSENKVDDYAELSSVRETHRDGSQTVLGGGTQHVFLHLTPKHGKRVLINNPPWGRTDAPEGDPSWRYSKLRDFFQSFGNVESMEVHYALPRPMRGLEVLHADPKAEILGVWKEADQLCVTTRGQWPDDDIEHRIFRDGKVGEKVPSPQHLIETEVVEKTTRLFPTHTSPDERWILGNRRDDGDLVLYDRQNEHFVKIGEDHGIDPKTYVPVQYLDAHGVFLVGRASLQKLRLGRSPFEWKDVYDLFILDPTTGAISAVTALNGKSISDPAFWSQRFPRKMQPVAGQPNVVWAASGHYTDPVSRFGQFDTKELEWVSYELLPFKGVSTRDIWVDEQGSKVYVVYKGHLLRIDLPQSLASEEKVKM